MLTFEEKYKIINDKNKSYDYVFLYGVKSTGIFCLPSCPSKKPNRENISFFDTEKEALLNGFRKCKRCFKADEKDKILNILVKENANLSLEELAKLSNFSKYHFIKKCKEYIGITPKQYFKQLTLNNIKKSIKKDNITTSIYKENLTSTSRFYEKSNEILGMTPKQYKKGGENTTIYFALGKCYLGDFLVAQTSKGICALFIGPPEKILKELQDSFPKAQLIGDDSNFKYTIAQIVALLEGESNINLSLDMSGTIFQKRVWEVLKHIPLGQTRSYSQIAEDMNMPKAARAVAKACATNKIAILIPCHRVVRNNGNISGYRWGVEVKERLLNREKTKL